MSILTEVSQQALRILQQHYQIVLDLVVSVQFDCADTWNGTNWESDCGCVAADNSGDDCDDCAGTPNGTNWESDCGCVAADNSGDDCDDNGDTPNGTNWESVW